MVTIPHSGQRCRGFAFESFSECTAGPGYLERETDLQTSAELTARLPLFSSVAGSGSMRLRRLGQAGAGRRFASGRRNPHSPTLPLTRGKSQHWQENETNLFARNSPVRELNQ